MVNAIRRGSVRLALLLLVPIVMAFGVAAPANAAAYTQAVYAPNVIAGGTALEGWALLSRDCSGTQGCWNYMKIERWQWWGMQYLNGNWVNNNGWNRMTASLPGGCGYYRTTVDSYNDIAGTYGGGVNIGPVGFTGNGTRVYRYKTTWSSGWRYACR
jgi:hypothetical protein